MDKDEKKRTTLDFGNLQKKSTEIDLNAIKTVALASGFRETPKNNDTIHQSPLRRTRRKTGRTEQFSTRLRPSTLQEIYNYADKHEITLAETIEQAITCLIKTNKI